MNYKRNMSSLLGLLALLFCANTLFAQSWTADNGNGTFTNPIFYDEFSDPDLIRVGDDFYMTGTTMHAMPGLPVLHSKDLVNWELLCYAFDRLNMGDEFKLENGKEVYGQSIWAPCIRYNNGTFYIFSNINGHGMQIFTAQNPAGPWKHTNLGGDIYDLSVLFDDDGKIYAVFGYDEVKMIEMKPDLTGYVEGSQRVIIPAGNSMGEGHHIYKIEGKYFIFSANYAPTGRMQCARADRPEGPYETVVVSVKETMGTQRALGVNRVGLWTPVPAPGDQFQLDFPRANEHGAVPLHQGGIVDLPNGDWWGFSMTDFRAIGRTTSLSPVTWVDGWPYFGLPGNLGRSPRTWIKPNIAVEVKPEATFKRSDNLLGKSLAPVWQWNHEPVDTKWSLNKKSGLRLHTMPAEHLLWAKNTLTQRGIGPESYSTVSLDASKLKSGDMAGLAIFNMPFATIGILKAEKGYILRWYNQLTNRTLEVPLEKPNLQLRAYGNFDKEIALLSYSADGVNFETVGDTIYLPYQLKTFQGTRIGLFAFNSEGKEGGYADFKDFNVEEPMADRSQNIPVGRIITLVNMSNNLPVWANPHGMLHFAWLGQKEYMGNGCQFRVHDRGQGRVVLEAMNGTGFVTIVGAGLSTDVRLFPQESEASLFQWQDLLYNQCMLLSLKTDRYVGLDPDTNESYAADWAGTKPNRKDGTVFLWSEVQ